MKTAKELIDEIVALGHTHGDIARFTGLSISGVGRVRAENRPNPSISTYMALDRAHKAFRRKGPKVK